MDPPIYTVFVRLPIARGDFVDPPPVLWDSNKDDALWKILSGAAQTEIDWNQVAGRFNVPVDFLIHQVDYLTERHASQVRAQVRKASAAAKGSSAPSPIPGSDMASPAHQRTASSLSARRDSPLPYHSGNVAARASVSRTSSANTVPSRDATSSSPRQGMSSANRRRLSALQACPTPTAIATPPPSDPTPAATDKDRHLSPGPADSSSSTSSDEDGSSPAQSRIIRRPPRSKPQDTASPYHDEDDNESEPAFQPIHPSLEPASQSSPKVLDKERGAALATNPSQQRISRDSVSYMSKDKTSKPASSPTSCLPKSPPEGQYGGPLAPRRHAELTGQSLHGKGKANSREGSDGTLSMGSSFSDLDDASVTQSALEEALASHMKLGNNSSSGFSISQAFRGR